ncbi:hypothetical protein Y1Q_0010353 [Alligator mississippiensis]|uniref:Uncharacterized protein n=1 Tax=Alligator mississippiensis TaxID=8496 RepID=A0A151NM97_ALLMI|nr:hypothetical protein Y1Q_0010353 [Alligator mississippiensis]
MVTMKLCNTAMLIYTQESSRISPEQDPGIQSETQLSSDRPQIIKGGKDTCKKVDEWYQSKDIVLSIFFSPEDSLLILVPEAP